MTTDDLPVDWVATLRPWRDAGVLGASDVHVAAALGRLAGVGDEDFPVVLAAALAARAPRDGHVCLDLTAARQSAPIEHGDDPDRSGDTDDGVDVDALDWPSDIGQWRQLLSASPLTASDGTAPLVVDGTRLYLQRYHDLEARLADQLLGRSTAAPSAAIAPDQELLDALLPGAASTLQRHAAIAGIERTLSVVVGGPGTGKTRTVAALVAMLLAAHPQARVALVAPTGKAAARMGDSLRLVAAQVRELGADRRELADRMEATGASTIHRLLGARPNGRFRHGRGSPLALDAVIVDEGSMVSLPLMVDLLDALTPETKLVLVGDPGQLASVEAGSVLSDIAGPTLDAALAGTPAPRGPLATAISVLTESHRFPIGSAVDRFAAAIRAGDADAALTVLTERSPAGEHGGVGLTWCDEAGDTARGADAVRDVALDPARRTVALSADGDATGALASLAEVRVLCAHRRGPFGVAHWNRRVEQWLAADGPAPRGFYLGRPVLVTANDPANGLFNGDLGVVVADGDERTVAFPHATAFRRLAPARLESIETVHAMTIHKSQGSEFDHVVVVLPPRRLPPGLTRAALHRGHPRPTTRHHHRGRGRAESRHRALRRAGERPGRSTLAGDPGMNPGRRTTSVR